ncbi:hypothetical protein DB347_02465 [Opitutaceae bacterium EW11]|nr:hypothetical protein DB347_02465 [Opitutaceae bacterium EW11]
MSAPGVHQPARPYFERIDVLRAVAIGLVFLHHYYTTLFSVPEKAAAFVQSWPAWLQRFETPFLLVPRMGYMGVQLFFVISGFCIHGSYLSWRKRNRENPTSSFLPVFFWRRFWRIVPAYLASLIVSYVLCYDHLLSRSSLRQLLVAATLLKTLVPEHFFTINWAHWSVAVEWQLYVVYPALLWFALWRGWRMTIVLAWALAAALQFVAPNFTHASYILHLPFTWWFEWTLGVLIAESQAQGQRVFAAHGWLAAGLVLATVVSFLCNWGPANWLGPRLLSGVVVEWMLLVRAPLGSFQRRLVSVGLCSYSVYLFHLPLIELIWRGMKLAGLDPSSLPVWILSGGVVFLLVLVVCWWSYQRLELGSVRLGDRLWKTWESRRKTVSITSGRASEVATGV